MGRVHTAGDPRSGPARVARYVASGIAAAVLVLVLGVAAPDGSGVAAAAYRGTPAQLVDVTTTILEPTTTTTLEPVTTTTTPPTTTTTTTEPRTTTTSSSTTSTTTPPVVQNTSSKTPWGLIVLIVVLVLAIVGIIVLLAARRRRGVEAAWRKAVVPAISDAQLARESLLSGNAVSDDPEIRGAVAVQVERASMALEHAVQGAPDPQAGTLATSAAGALRGLAFAIEADRLLRHGTAAPSGMQLAQADEARRARTAELNSALVRLSTRIGSAPG
jgi:hypothetical protein